MQFFLRLVIACSLFLSFLCGGSLLLKARGQALRFLSSGRWGEWLRPAAEPEQGLFFYEGIGKISAEGLVSVKKPPKEDTPALRYTLELQEAQAQGAAQGYLEQLHSKGLQAYYTPLRTQSGVVFKVRYGVYATEDSARAAQQDLAANWQISSTVTLLR